MSSISILPTHVIDSLNRFIKSKYSLIKNVTFDPQAGYETTIGQLRISQSMSSSDRLKRESLPLLSWNRSVLRRASSGRPIRSITKDESGTWVDIEASVNSFDFKFIFMATNMADTERFELDYYNKTGINDITESIVRIPNLGEFTASVVWDQNLEDIVFNLEGNYYKALSGSATITGTFLTASTADPSQLRNLIEQITFSIKTCRGGDLPDVYTIIPE